MHSPGRGLRSSSRGSFLYSLEGGLGLPCLPRDDLFFLASANRKRHQREVKHVPVSGSQIQHEYAESGTATVTGKIILI